MTALLDRSRLAAIHAEAKKAGLDEDSRRDLMQSVTGKRSSRDLTSAEADRVIERLKVLSGGREGPLKAPSRPLRLTVSGPYAGKLRALWLSGYNLGVVRDRQDSALIAFAERQTGLSHTRFLKSPRDAAKVIEALKSWLSRETGIAWPAGLQDVTETKRALVRAQLAILGGGNGGCYQPTTAAAKDTVLRAINALSAGADLDGAASALGVVLRREIAKRRVADDNRNRPSVNQRVG